jgi:integrase
MEDGKIVANPAAKPGRFLPPKTHAKEHIRALTREELALLLRTIQQGWPDHFPFFLTLARAGLRLGEALALQWGDIDWHGGFIGVGRGLRKGVLSSTKSKKSRRVDMSRQLKDTLRVLHETRKEQAWRNGWAEMPPWVFCTEDGRPTCDVTLRRDVLGPALHRAGLRAIRIHDLRHTFASLLLQQGESVTYVKEQMGHHSIQVTVDTYGHLVPGGNRQAVDRLDDRSEISPEATNRNPAATTLNNAVFSSPLSA